MNRGDQPLTLDGIYPLPDPLTSLESYQRHSHLDLPLRARVDLLRERDRLRLRLLLEEAPDPWLLERMQRLTENLDGTRGPRHG